MMINIMITGVGGQGSLLASRILGALFDDAGLDVKVSEVHGMSQRGGSVVTYVRAGENVASPLIERGGADVVLAFEQLEAARYVHHLKKGGAAVYSTQKIMPMPVVSGAAEYPEGIEEKLIQAGAKTAVVDALALAEQAGSAKAANVVMLGALSTMMDYSRESWLKAVRACVKPKFEELNVKAFELGRAAAGNQEE